MRVYVPSSSSRLRRIVGSGGIGPPPVFGHAVTDSLRSDFSDGGEDEWEYAAFSAAAQDSIGLLAEGDAPRRVVVVIDADSVIPIEGQDSSLVEVEGVVPLRGVAAVHVDSREAEARVVGAREAWADAANGDERCRDIVARCLDHELGWYAAQEIGDLFPG